MLDKLEKTRRLIATLEAASPLDISLTPEVVTALAAGEGGAVVEPRQTVSDISYAGDEGGIMCHLLAEEGRGAIYVSLTYVRVQRALPFAAAVIDYQKHRAKKIKKLDGRM